MTVQKRHKAHIVLIEDDEILRGIVEDILVNNGYFVKAFDRVNGVLDWINENLESDEKRVNLIISDIELPDGNGLEIFESLTQPYLGKILISVRDKPLDRITGLKIGADDYLPKPIDPIELLLRTENVLKNKSMHEKSETDGRKQEETEEEFIPFGEYKLHPENRRLIIGDDQVLLTEREHQILLYMISKRGRVVTREELANALGFNKFNDGKRSIDVQIGRLRKKMEVNPRAPQYIVTKRGRGYFISCGN